jgi:hypothetical protein
MTSQVYATREECDARERQVRDMEARVLAGQFHRNSNIEQMRSSNGVDIEGPEAQRMIAAALGMAARDDQLLARRPPDYPPPPSADMIVAFPPASYLNTAPIEHVTGWYRLAQKAAPDSKLAELGRHIEEIADQRGFRPWLGTLRPDCFRGLELVRKDALVDEPWLEPQADELDMSECVWKVHETAAADVLRFARRVREIDPEMRLAAVKSISQQRMRWADEVDRWSRGSAIVSRLHMAAIEAVSLFDGRPLPDADSLEKIFDRYCRDKKWSRIQPPSDTDPSLRDPASAESVVQRCGVDPKDAAAMAVQFVRLVEARPDELSARAHEAVELIRTKAEKPMHLAVTLRLIGTVYQLRNWTMPPEVAVRVAIGNEHLTGGMPLDELQRIRAVTVPLGKDPQGVGARARKTSVPTNPGARGIGMADDPRAGHAR